MLLPSSLIGLFSQRDISITPQSQTRDTSVPPQGEESDTSVTQPRDTSVPPQTQTRDTSVPPHTQACDTWCTTMREPRNTFLALRGPRALMDAAQGAEGMVRRAAAHALHRIHAHIHPRSSTHIHAHQQLQPTACHAAACSSQHRFATIPKQTQSGDLPCSWPRGTGFSPLPSAVTSTVDHPLGSPSLYSTCRSSPNGEACAEWEQFEGWLVEWCAEEVVGGGPGRGGNKRRRDWETAEGGAEGGGSVPRWGPPRVGDDVHEQFALGRYVTEFGLSTRDCY
jgi:hypothetical protein